MVLQYIVANQVHARRPSSTSLWTHWGAAISIKRTVAAEPCRRKARKSNTNVRITTRVDWVPSKRRCRNVQWMSGRKLHEAAGLRCTSLLPYLPRSLQELDHTQCVCCLQRIHKMPKALSAFGLLVHTASNCSTRTVLCQPMARRSERSALTRYVVGGTHC